jgi:hypothetical protein
LNFWQCNTVSVLGTVDHMGFFYSKTLHRGCAIYIRTSHRLNMKLDLQSLFGLHGHSCTHWLWLRPRNPPAPPPPQHLGSYTSAILVSQDRRHLFVTPWYQPRKYNTNLY